MRCRMVKQLAAVIFFVVTVHRGGRAAGAGIRDLDDGWLLGPRAVAAVSGVDMAATRGLWALFGHSRLYGMVDLPVVAVAVGVGTGGGRSHAALSWQSTGDEFFRQDLWGGSFQYGRSLGVGLDWRGSYIRFAGTVYLPPRRLHRWQVDLTIFATRVPVPDAHLEVKLWVPIIGTSAGPHSGADRRPLVRVQGWNDLFVLAAAVDLGSDQTPAVGAEWDLRLGRATAGWRIDVATGTLGPVFSWCRNRFLLRTSHLVHPELGLTHRIQLGWGDLGAAPW